MNCDTGSFRSSLPSSMSIRTATLVTAFDCDAMRKMVSFCIGDVLLEVQPAVALELHDLAVAQDQRDEARHAALVGVVLHRGAEVRDARRRQPHAFGRRRDGQRLRAKRRRGDASRRRARVRSDPANVGKGAHGEATLPRPSTPSWRGSASPWSLRHPACSIEGRRAERSRDSAESGQN